MNYKRKGHRGRHKKNAMDNNSSRCAGNGRMRNRSNARVPRRHSTAKAQRNTPLMEELD